MKASNDNYYLTITTYFTGQWLDPAQQKSFTKTLQLKMTESIGNPCQTDHGVNTLYIIHYIWFFQYLKDLKIY